MGDIQFNAGTPVSNGPTGNVFDYIYKVTFSGGPQFSLTETVTVPEPKGMGFVMGGVVVLGIYQGWFGLRRKKLAKKVS